MIPGIGGELLSGGYLARHVSQQPAGDPAGFAAWTRGMAGWWRRIERALGPASSPRATLDVSARPLLELLGYSLTRIEPHPWGHAGLLSVRGHAVAAMLSAGWSTPPDRAWRHALHASLAARLPWAFILTGTRLAIVDGTRPWSRRLLSFDMDVVCRDLRALQALWLLARAEACGPDESSALRRAVAASDRHGAEVCAALGGGVLAALGEFVAAFDGVSGPRRRQRGLEDVRVFDQSLTVVYRLLFLFFAEARRLVPVWHRVYRDAYSMEALCRRLVANSHARGVWLTVQAMSRLAHAGCRADDLSVTPFNGRLFSPAWTPLGERRRVPDASAARAVLALGTTATREGRRPIAFHDLGVEQLGAVYERVLDYEPVRRRGALTLQPTSTERKTSGSFYTPRAITDFVVRRTLGPMVAGRSSNEILSLRIIDPAMGSGAFLVSACRYLALRVEQALVAEGAWVENEAGDAERAELLRTIAERCLYGIDINPTAVQLARLSLWLTTLSADRPLTFLDHHLAVGNSLVGARLADLARAPGPSASSRATGDLQLPLFDHAALASLARAVVPERLRMALDPSTTPSAVREKQQRLDRLLAGTGALARWARAADLWSGLALDRSARPSAGLYGELQRHAAGLETTLPSSQCVGPCARAIDLARRHGACHWELTFPEVFLDERGDARPDAGFDAVIGNPPWEVMRADTGDRRRRDQTRRDTRALLGFVRGSGHYPLQGRGQLNHYQLFVERTLQALNARGRFGLILPSGIQSDVGSADLRRTLLDTCRIDTWLGFDNRRGILPIHRGIRFVLLAGGRGDSTPVVPLACGLADAVALDQLPDDPRTEIQTRSRVHVAREFLDRWDLAHLTIPTLTGPLDAGIAHRALTSPALSSPEGWQVTFGRELNATDDGAHFIPCGARPRRNAAGARLLPVVDGKHLRPFGVALDRVSRCIDAETAARLLGATSSPGRDRVCYRDVASASNRVTLIAALLPAGVVSTHTVFCAKQPLPSRDAWCLIGLLNSLVANYLVRLQMSTHVTVALMARLPVPRPPRESSECHELAALARAMSRLRTAEDDSDRYVRLNVLAARLYGLRADELACVVSTFPLLPEALARRVVEQYGS